MPMPDEPKPEPLPTSQYGFFAWVAKLLFGLTTERALMVFVCFGFGVLGWKMLDQYEKWQERTDRAHEEARESDRRNCDADKAQIRADSLAREKAQQDSFRAMQKDLITHWANEAERTRLVIVEAVKMEVNRLAKKGGDEEFPAVAPSPKLKAGPRDSPRP